MRQPCIVGAVRISGVRAREDVDLANEPPAPLGRCQEEFAPTPQLKGGRV
jgi:hypothetical protein